MKNQFTKLAISLVFFGYTEKRFRYHDIPFIDCVPAEVKNGVCNQIVNNPEQGKMEFLYQSKFYKDGHCKVTLRVPKKKNKPDIKIQITN